jgi:hypothetical protein
MRLNRATVILICFALGFAQGYVVADDQRIKRETGVEVVL